MTSMAEAMRGMEAVGVETTFLVPICGSVRVYAGLMRTEAHRDPSELLQTATT